MLAQKVRPDTIRAPRGPAFIARHTANCQAKKFVSNFLEEVAQVVFIEQQNSKAKKLKFFRPDQES